LSEKLNEFSILYTYIYNIFDQGYDTAASLIRLVYRLGKQKQNLGAVHMKASCLG